MQHMSEYRDWEIAVTPREEAPMLWRALIKVWPPGTRLADPRSTGRVVHGVRDEPGRDPQGRQTPRRGTDQHCARGPRVGGAMIAAIYARKSTDQRLADLARLLE
jgi:hypothetical protein